MISCHLGFLWLLVCKLKACVASDLFDELLHPLVVDAAWRSGSFSALLDLNVVLVILAIFASTSAIAVYGATDIFQRSLAALPAFDHELAIVEMVDVALNFLIDVSRIHLLAVS